MYTPIDYKAIKSKRDYSIAMAKIGNDLPHNWINDAVKDIFPEFYHTNNHNQYYRLIRNVKAGNSFSKGMELNIIKYIIKKYNQNISKIH